MTTTTSKHPIRFVDVFGRAGLSGNPLAVVHAAQDLDTDTMQSLTRWLNLSETTFLLPPTTEEADYRVRIFTLDREMPFAGHPTLGTCQAWLAAGGRPKTPGVVVQECGAGLVKVRRDAERLAFAAPPLVRSGPIDDALLIEACAILGVDRSAVKAAQWVDNGPGWIAVLLDSAEAVLALNPVRSHHRRIDIGVVGPHPAGAEAAFELRALFSDQHGGVMEDPVTGSLNASVAQWLYASGRVEGPYVAAQGTRLGRTGRVFVDRDETGQVWIGGTARIQVTGELDL
jgi:PhzF family phenazine biosynthesis protein